ncbi:T9SS type A sorting domain-containing protein [Gelidibacter maritimus]|uniref:T9SS type A sorting domain-containing protein n=1 Tax=Gelidibacter maritimus TaxID=2761487 RepID=A0A7W2M4V8_9FLAO|nr:T9SS type A sorting domain-containing protein [Gelidibacter maritimus]MBA6152496.1 T9SS type A sorting domain-containing protein [Gelidibacter maritimus]
MRCKLLLLLIALTTFNTFGQTTYIFDGDGSWTDETQWKDGNYPGLTVNLNDTVEILGKLIIPEDISVTNNGTIESFSSANGAVPDLTIRGEFKNLNTIKFSRIQINVTTTGNVVLSDSETIITNSSTFTNSGKVVVFAGGVLTLNNSTSSIINDTTGLFTNYGTVNVFNGKLENNNTYMHAIRNGATMTVTGGEIINRGGFSNDNNGHLHIKRYFNNEVTGLLINSGELSISEFTSSLINAGSFHNNKNVHVGDGTTLNMLDDSSFIIQSGTVTVSANGKIENRASAFELRAGKVLNNGTINNETEILIRYSGELENNGTLKNLGAQITNLGTLTGINIEHGSHFSNDGVLSPGNSSTAIGTYRFDDFINNYTQTASGSLNIELAGTVAGVSHDQVIVKKIATLGGTLNVTLINGFEPAIGDVFTVLYQGDGIVGSFATVNLPTLSADKEWDAVEYSDTDGVRISVKKSTLSISDANAESLKYKIYPNPASNEIFVSGITMPSKAIIFDLNGRRILEMELSRDKPSVELNTLEPGVYFLNVETKTFKFVKI